LGVLCGNTNKLTIINIYAYTANADPEHKEHLYKQLKATQNRLGRQGPTYTMGDFNARIQILVNDEEKQIIGEHLIRKTSGK
jgi:hypothetical protein